MPVVAHASPTSVRVRFYSFGNSTIPIPVVIRRRELCNARTYDSHGICIISFFFFFALSRRFFRSRCPGIGSGGRLGAATTTVASAVVVMTTFFRNVPGLVRDVTRRRRRRRRRPTSRPEPATVASNWKGFSSTPGVVSGGATV